MQLEEYVDLTALNTFGLRARARYFAALADAADLPLLVRRPVPMNSHRRVKLLSISFVLIGTRASRSPPSRTIRLSAGIAGAAEPLRWVKNSGRWCLSRCSVYLPLAANGR